MTFRATRDEPAVQAMVRPVPTGRPADVRTRATEAMQDVLRDALASKLASAGDIDGVAARCADIALEIVAEAAMPAARALMWADPTDPAVQRAVTCLDECL